MCTYGLHTYSRVTLPRVDLIQVAFLSVTLINTGQRFDIPSAFWEDTSRQQTTPPPFPPGDISRP